MVYFTIGFFIKGHDLGSMLLCGKYILKQRTAPIVIERETVPTSSNIYTSPYLHDLSFLLCKSNYPFLYIFCYRTPQIDMKLEV